MDAHLRDLRYFVTVADELNITRAAERLHVSLPALSKQRGAGDCPSRATLFAVKGFDFEVLDPPKLVAVLRALSDRLCWAVERLSVSADKPSEAR